MPNEFDLKQSAKYPGNIYMTRGEATRHGGDVMGSDPYYRMMPRGPEAYQFPAGVETDADAYAANMAAIGQNAVPTEFARSMWMRQTPNGMVYTTADKLFAGSDYTDHDLSRRERAVRAQGWMPAIEGGVSYAE